MIGKAPPVAIGALPGRLWEGRRCAHLSASLIDATEEEEIAARAWEIADPVGTSYRYSLPASLLHRRVVAAGDGGGTER